MREKVLGVGKAREMTEGWGGEGGRQRCWEIVS